MRARAARAAAARARRAKKSTSPPTILFGRVRVVHERKPMVSQKPVAVLACPTKLKQ
jgi:hypothetical protein